jgi:hypothetical protein
MGSRIIFINLILCVVLFGCPAFAQDSGSVRTIEVKADKVLRQMSEYLNTLEHFSIHVESSADALLDYGQKIQLGRSVDVNVWRPNRLMADIKGDFIDQQLFYDGKQITLFGKRVNYYATMEVSATIESALDYAEQSFGLVAPAADLIYQNSYDILTEDVQSGGYIGLSTVLGVECHHLAFRGKETDWQIWVENSETPFPRKFVITSKWMAGSPQFTALLTNWDASAQLKDSLFTFTKQDKAEKIEFLPLEN